MADEGWADPPDGSPVNGDESVADDEDVAEGGGEGEDEGGRFDKVVDVVLELAGLL